MRVLGIDPGSRHCGYGLVEAARGKTRYLDSGRISLPASEPLSDRLSRLHDALAGVIARHAPDAAAVEKIFFAKNVRSALSLGQARGVVLAAVAAAGVPVQEYSALEIKKAVVGYGRADKAQVQTMVVALLGLRRRPTEDEADALAVALCHTHASALNSKLQAALARHG